MQRGDAFMKRSLHYEPDKRPYESDGSPWKTFLQPRSGEGDILPCWLAAGLDRNNLPHGQPSGRADDRGTARRRERTAVRDARSASFASSLPSPRLRRGRLYYNLAMKIK